MWTLKVDEEITLRQVRKEIAPEVYSIVASDRLRLSRFMAWASAENLEENTIEWAKLAEENFAAGKTLQTCILVADQVVGTMGFNDIDGSSDSGEIGYWIASSHEGRGIVSRAVRALTKHGFEELGLNRIVIRCATDNGRSKAIPKRLGYKFEGILREAGKLPSGYVDLEVYSMLKREFEEIL